MRLLIADDELRILEGLRDMIDWQEHGITQVDTARTGSEALEKCVSQGYDILVADIRMPKMTGLELAEKLLQLRQDCRVILLSGYAEFEYAQKAISLNVVSYLLKPVDIDELTRLVDRLVFESIGFTAGNLLIEKAKDFTKDNLGMPISVKDVAEHVGRNTSYFSHMFKKVEGISFTAYLTSLRIAKAKRLLVNTDAMTYEIAESVGFSDYRYFTQTFKKFAGLAPSEYRKHNGKV